MVEKSDRPILCCNTPAGVVTFFAAYSAINKIRFFRKPHILSGACGAEWTPVYAL
jgi:hypothetical protein